MPIDNEQRSENGTKRKFEELQNTENVVEMAKPLVAILLNKHFPVEGKISCLSAISSLITKDRKICEYLAKIDIYDEIANLAEKVEKKANDLNVIGRIFSQLNCLDQGKELFGQVRMRIEAYDKLKKEMEKFEVSGNPKDFAFTSEESKCQKRFKIELVKIE